jgi:hypothetical protein
MAAVAARNDSGAVATVHLEWLLLMPLPPVSVLPCAPGAACPGWTGRQT